MTRTVTHLALRERAAYREARSLVRRIEAATAGLPDRYTGRNGADVQRFYRLARAIERAERRAHRRYCAVAAAELPPTEEVVGELLDHYALTGQWRAHHTERFDRIAAALEGRGQSLDGMTWPVLSDAPAVARRRRELLGR